MGTVKDYYILFADNDISYLEKLVEKLKIAGFSVSTAADIDAAIQLVETFEPDIILIDVSFIHNAQENRLEQFKILISSERTSIIVTTINEDMVLKNLSLPGINDLIVKPFGFKELLAHILNQLRIKELETKNKDLLEKVIQLEQLAITDELTGLYNRRYIVDRLHCEVSHSSRYNEPLSFILLDLDHFKNINDTYGHLAGDELLKYVASRIKDSVREADIPARYGGEEFVVICPRTSLDGCMVVAERIRFTIENSIFKLKDMDLRVTVSMGISSKNFKPPVDASSEATTLIYESDIALYNAKEKGRNRVEVFNDENSDYNDMDDSTNLQHESRTEFPH